tara:strand:- start:2540 stop:2872 length:333 start_codon:yes stop_codon:yes gene_type:complete
MIPGVNPKQMQAAMKKMGIKQEDLDATEVIIKTKTKEIIISNPQVAKVDMMGQTTYQISGPESERDIKPMISADDVKMVSSQANVSEEKAKEALESADGDLAKAILELKQ